MLSFHQFCSHRLYIFILLAFGITTTNTYAAEIRKSPTSDCVIEITGSIEKGDYGKFSTMAGLIFPEDYGETTSQDIVCLNSPGGDWLEGMLFSRHFVEKGVSTVIRAKDGCNSVCAIMFMMGSYLGAEGSGISRKLHVSARLGFNRPYSGTQGNAIIGERENSSAYNNALTYVLDLITLANIRLPWTTEPMMKADLIQEMLSHTNEGLFYINNVDKAGRWGIELYGFKPLSKFKYEQAYYACENTMQWMLGQTRKNVALEFVLIESIDRSRPIIRTTVTPEGHAGLSITGYDAGYAGEGCFFQISDGRLRGCGWDEAMDVSFGNRVCSAEIPISNHFWVSALSKEYPWTTLKELEVRSTTNSPAPKHAKCFVISNGKVIDNENCQVGFSATTKLNNPVIDFNWPSGSKTILELNANGYFLNGDHAEEDTQDGYDRCFKNRRTGNLFCYKKHEKI